MRQLNKDCFVLSDAVGSRFFLSMVTQSLGTNHQIRNFPAVAFSMILVIVHEKLKFSLKSRGFAVKFYPFFVLFMKIL